MFGITKGHVITSVVTLGLLALLKRTSFGQKWF